MKVGSEKGKENDAMRKEIRSQLTSLVVPSSRKEEPPDGSFLAGASSSDDVHAQSLT